MHGRITSHNILFSSDFTTVKLGRISLAGVHQLSGPLMGSMGTTRLAYAAPELLINQQCTTAADMYSVGCLLWELATHQIPIRGALRPVIVSHAHLKSWHWYCT